MTSTGTRKTEAAPPRNRLILGTTLFVTGMICPVFVPLVNLEGLR